MKDSTQSFHFLFGEGDAWHDRNPLEMETVRFAADIITITKALDGVKNDIEKIVEIGCADGTKLKILCETFDAKGFGIDPSLKAVEHGNSKYGNDLELHQGLASSLPFGDYLADLVIFGFCLYLNDRETLVDAINEADRVLKNSGFMIITDFDPGGEIINKYKHKEGVFSFKEDYAKYFLENNYILLEKHSFSHSQDCIEMDINERVSTQILLKR